MSGIKKARGKDKKKRKTRKPTTMKPAHEESPEPKRNILRNIINAVSKKVKKEKAEPWAFDFGEHSEPPLAPRGVLGSHVFHTYKHEIVEIDLKEL